MMRLACAILTDDIVFSRRVLAHFGSLEGTPTYGQRVKPFCFQIIRDSLAVSNDDQRKHCDNKSGRSENKQNNQNCIPVHIFNSCSPGQQWRYPDAGTRNFHAIHYTSGKGGRSTRFISPLALDGDWAGCKYADQSKGVGWDRAGEGHQQWGSLSRYPDE
jgi:hypothetical protein